MTLAYTCVALHDFFEVVEKNTCQQELIHEEKCRDCPESTEFV